LKVRPSDLRTMAFCPRLLFFEMHLEKEISLRQRLRMLLGKMWHAIMELLLVQEREVVIEGEIDGFEISGRADGLKDEAVIELKSGRAPSDGVWYGDFLQALSYAVLLHKNKIIVKYRDKEVSMDINEAHKDELVEALRKLSLIADGYLPPPKRNKWCSKCPYKELCEELGDEWDDWFGKIPWIKKA